MSHHAPKPKQWDKKSKVFSNKRGQAPSYCDRILLRSFPGVASDIRQDNVLGCHDFLGSDHRPVRSSYTLHLRKLYTAQPEPSKYLATTPPTFFSAVPPFPPTPLPFARPEVCPCLTPPRPSFPRSLTSQTWVCPSSW